MCNISGITIKMRLKKMEGKKSRLQDLTETLIDIKTAAQRLESESKVTEEIIRELDWLKKTRARNCDLRKALDKARSKRWRWWPCC